MDVYYISKDNIPSMLDNYNLLLGVFDSLHIGHQTLINNAKKDHLKVGLLLLDLKDTSLIANKSPYSINSLEDKIEILSSLKVDYVFVLSFDNNIKNMSAVDFINDILIKLHPNKIFVGDDYTFGKDKSGNILTLKRYFNVDVLPLSKDKISTKNIISHILNGEIKIANKMLGRNYRVKGLVKEGLHNGTKIGFPTCNVHLNYRYPMPKIGVYIGKTYVDDEPYFGIVSVSTHPTIDELEEPLIEINIYGINRNLYHQNLTVEFIDRIGDIVKFDNLDKLKIQLQKYKDYLQDNYINNIN